MQRKPLLVFEKIMVYEVEVSEQADSDGKLVTILRVMHADKK